MYKYSASKNAFYPDSLIPEYTNSGTLPDDLLDVSDDIFMEYTGIPPSGKLRGADENGMPTWLNEPDIPNQKKLIAALSAIGKQYQDDVTTMNIAWLAAAVSDGVNETAKKDAVIAQINDRKTKYAADRAAIIAQYPED